MTELSPEMEAELRYWCRTSAGYPSRGVQALLHALDAERRLKPDVKAIVAERDEAWDRVAALKAENERLRKKTALGMGIGDVSGQLFVYGDYDSIKAAQRLVFDLEAERLRVDELDHLLPSDDERALLERIRAGTHVCVPKEPTETMLEAGCNALVEWTSPAMHSGECYRAMVKAAAQEEQQS